MCGVCGFVGAEDESFALRAMCVFVVPALHLDDDVDEFLFESVD